MLLLQEIKIIILFGSKKEDFESLHQILAQYAKCDRVLAVRKKSIVCYTHQIQKQSN
jgi:ADP-heptose:LPS heptosyltransferase